MTTIMGSDEFKANAGRRKYLQTMTSGQNGRTSWYAEGSASAPRAFPMPTWTSDRGLTASGKRGHGYASPCPALLVQFEVVQNHRGSTGCMPNAKGENWLMMSRCGRPSCDLIRQDENRQRIKRIDDISLPDHVQPVIAVLDLMLRNRESRASRRKRFRCNRVVDRKRGERGRQKVALTNRGVKRKFVNEVWPQLPQDDSYDLAISFFPPRLLRSRDG